MMNIRVILILTLCLVVFHGVTVTTSDATTIFGGSKIITTWVQDAAIRILR
jgi:hypothetical protein